MAKMNSLYDLESLFIEKLQEKYKLNERDLKRAFSRFDLDNNGLLDLNEMVKGIQSFLNGVKPSQVQELVEHYDTNGDGKLSYEEFLHFLQHRTAIDPSNYDDPADDQDYAGYAATAGRGGKQQGSGSYGMPMPPAPAPSGRGNNNKQQLTANALAVAANAGNAGNYSNRPPLPPGTAMGGARPRNGAGRDGFGRNASQQQQAAQQARGYNAAAAYSETASSSDAADDSYGYYDGDGDDVNYAMRSMQLAGHRQQQAAAQLDPDTGSEVPSELFDAHDPRSLEYRTKIYLHNLRSYFMKKATSIRLQNQSKAANGSSLANTGIAATDSAGQPGKKVALYRLTADELYESVARDLLIKAFQPYTGMNDGRPSSANYTAAQVGSSQSGSSQGGSKLGRQRLQGIEYSDFAKVIRSFTFGGCMPIRPETVQYLFDLCSHTSAGSSQPLVNEEGRPVADANKLIELIFGGHYASRAEEVATKGHAIDLAQTRLATNTASISADHGGLAGSAASGGGTGGSGTAALVGKHQGAIVDKQTGMLLKSYEAKLNAGRTSVGTGPMQLATATNAQQEKLMQLLAVPLRFVSRKSRSSLVVPSSFDPLTVIPHSNSLPAYSLVRKHVFGLSTTHYSGNMVYVLPRTPTIFLTPAAATMKAADGAVLAGAGKGAGRGAAAMSGSQQGSQMIGNQQQPITARNNPDFIDSATIVYASAGLGVVHHLPTNTQRFFDNSEDDITCLALSRDGCYAATGVMGKEAVVHIWEVDIQHSRSYLATLGRGFFTRGVCAVEFSYDNKYLVGIACDDNHALAIFEISSGVKVLELASAHGVPPQINWLRYAPSMQFTEWITRDHQGLCDLFLTLGQRHARVWSFTRSGSTVTGNTTKADASLNYKGLAISSKQTNAPAMPKVTTCGDFIACEDKSLDIVTAGSNGIAYLWRKGQLIAYQQVMRGRIQCLIVQQDKVYLGGIGGVVSLVDGRTLAILRSFYLLGPSVAMPSAKATTAASGQAGQVSKVLTSALGKMIPKARATSSTGSRASSATSAQRKAGTASGKPIGTGSNAATKMTAKTYEDRPAAGRASYQDASTEEEEQNPDTVESGAKMVVGLAMVSNPGVHGNSYLIAALGTGKIMRVDISMRGGGAGSDQTAAAAGSFSGKELIYYHTGPVYGLAADVTTSQRLFVTVGDDRKLCVWDALDCVLVAKTQVKTPSRCVHLDKTNSFLAVGSTNGSLTIFFLTDTLRGHHGQHSLAQYYKIQEVAFRKDCTLEVTEVKFSPSNTMIAMGARDDHIYLYTCQLVVVQAGQARNQHLVGSCQLKAYHKLRGHSATITHLDWSFDSVLLRSTCSAYELLCWDVPTGKQNTTVNIADVRWNTNHCILGFPVMGIWPMYSDGTDINAIDVSPEKGLVVTANDDHGLVRMMNYPCIVKNPPVKETTGHSSHVMNIKFLKGSEHMITVGGNDGSAMVFDVVLDPQHPDPFREVNNRR